MGLIRDDETRADDAPPRGPLGSARTVERLRDRKLVNVSRELMARLSVVSELPSGRFKTPTSAEA